MRLVVKVTGSSLGVLRRISCAGLVISYTAPAWALSGVCKSKVCLLRDSVRRPLEPYAHIVGEDPSGLLTVVIHVKGMMTVEVVMILGMHAWCCC